MGKQSSQSVMKKKKKKCLNYDEDTQVFISMSQELKDEGNKLFQRRDYEGAILKFEKAFKLLPGNHIDVSCLHTNVAACYMHMGLSEYPRAIHHCDLALQVTPKYSKALLKRARCYVALDNLRLALQDVNMVLKMEPNNLMATELATTILGRGDQKSNDIPVDTVLQVPELHMAASPLSILKDKTRKKQSGKIEVKKLDEMVDQEKKHESSNKIGDRKSEENKADDKIEDKFEENEIKIEEKKAEDKLVVEENIANAMEEEPKRTVKLVFGEDIRWAQIPVNCSILKLMEIIRDRFPNSKPVLIKYRDQEGDLVTITTTEELRWAEASNEHVSTRLYIVEVKPEQDPLSEKVKKELDVIHKVDAKQSNITENGCVEKSIEFQKKPCCIDDWIVLFAHLFKNYAGFGSDAYLDLHEIGMELYSEAMEETVTSEEAQDLFNTAAEKFQEMSALALFNWGNVHMSRARKRVFFAEDASRESVLVQVKNAYDWAQNEYSKAGIRYEEALKIKPNFYEAVVALSQQQYEQAKLSWYYAIGTNADLKTWPYAEVLHLYNRAEENMEKGMQMWEEVEERRLSELSQPSKAKIMLQKMKLDDFVKDISADEAAEQVANMSAQINLLWGTMLYERSIMEFKLGLPVWQECLEVAIEKFELAGASVTDIAVMIKNHCSNNSTQEGLGFNINEIIQAWNQMYEAKRWHCGIPSFRLEPLLRRRVSKLYHALEHK